MYGKWAGKRSRGGEDRTMQDVMFSTMSEILDTDSNECRNAALHGLRHIRHPATLEVIQAHRSPDWQVGAETTTPRRPPGGIAFTEGSRQRDDNGPALPEIPINDPQLVQTYTFFGNSHFFVDRLPKILQSNLTKELKKRFGWLLLGFGLRVNSAPCRKGPRARFSDCSRFRGYGHFPGCRCHLPQGHQARRALTQASRGRKAIAGQHVGRAEPENLSPRVSGNALANCSKSNHPPPAVPNQALV
jgi:hypothetical protein